MCIRDRHHGVGKAGGVKVDAETVFLGKGHPRGKVPVFDLIPVRPFAVRKNGIGGVQIDALFTRDEGCRLQKIGLQLFKIAGAARVVARGLDAVAGLAVLLVKACLLYTSCSRPQF